VAGALLTDLYELNMAASYLKRGMTAPATFSLIVRELPRGWGFLVACGLERCLEYLEHLSFEPDDLAYLEETQGYPAETLDALGELRFTGDVVAVPEGRIVFADEPLLEVTAPLPEAQIAETYLLNQLTYQTAVASTAARCRIAAPGKDLVDFSFRRVHGGEAGFGVARATAISGFSATSNVAAARWLGLRATGTMAHSYVEAFPSEAEAFRAFAADFPDRVILLVDTYDTLRGVQRAIDVGRELRDRGERLLAIRLDSGDFASLSREARAMLDTAGLADVRILASGGLDARAIAALAGSPIDAFGVGSKVGVAHEAPFLDSVYKLVDYDGRPVAKLSTHKETLPGRKQAWRLPGFGGDLLGLREEDGPHRAEPLLEPVMRGGRRITGDGLAEARDRFASELAALPERLRSLDAEPERVERSPGLEALTRDVRGAIEQRELSP